MSIIKEIKKNKILFLMTIPGVLTLILFNYLPMFGIVIAFKDFNYQKGIWGSRWIGLRNFEFLFKSSDAFLITRNTILYNVAFIVLGLIASVFIAIALSEIKNSLLAKYFQTAMLLPHFLSWVVISYLVFSFLSYDRGLLNTGLLRLLGMDPVNWYSDPKPWPFFIILIDLWKHTGYSSVIYLASITGINQEYYESAMLDGATKWQQIRRITIPLISPQIIILTLIAIGRIFNADFGLFYQVPMNSGILYPVTNVIDTYIYIGLTSMNNIGMTSAAGLYQAVIGFILVIGSNLLVRKIDNEKALF
jgi:putative aldouronate transport system permease protein